MRHEFIVYDTTPPEDRGYPNRFEVRRMLRMLTGKRWHRSKTKEFNYQLWVIRRSLRYLADRRAYDEVRNLKRQIELVGPMPRVSVPRSLRHILGRYIGGSK